MTFDLIFMCAATVAIVLLIVAVFAVIVRLMNRGYDRYQKLPSQDDFRAKRPDESCLNCGTRSTRSQEVGRSGGQLLLIHACKQCGLALYRSASAL